MKSVKQISKEYNASISSIYKIVKNCKNLTVDNHNLENYRSKCCKLNREEKKCIKEFVKPPQIILTIEKINNGINDSFGAKNRKRDIKLYMKKQLNYPFKKGSSKL